MKRQKREVRLSRPGKVFVGLTLALGFAAVNTGNNVLFLLVSMMLSLMVLSGFVALANIWRVEVRLQPGQILSAEETGDLLLRIHNNKPWPLWLMELQLGASRQAVTRIAARQEAVLTLRWCPPRRGQPPLPVLKMGSAFPFSFVWRGQQIPVSGADMPWVAPAEGLAVPALRDPGEKHEATDKAGGQGDFLWIRDWRPGESLHQIVWRRVDWSQNFPVAMIFPGREQEKSGQAALLLDWEAPQWQDYGREQRLQIFRAALEKAWAQGWFWQLQMPTGAQRAQGRMQSDKALLLLAQLTPFPPETDPDTEAAAWSITQKFRQWGQRFAGLPRKVP